MSETYTEQLSRVRLMASGDYTWDLVDDDTAALTGVLARLDELEGALGERRHIGCIYCGHQTFFKGLTPEEATAKINEHIFSCEKRPEAGLLLVLASILHAIGVDADALNPAGRAEALAAAAVDAVSDLLEEVKALRKHAGTGAPAVSPESRVSSKVQQAIADERSRQDAQWGGPPHDDKHEPMDWMDYIGQQLEKFAKNVIVRGQDYCATPDARQRFVKIAALSVAAMESFERKDAQSQEVVKP